LFGGVSDDDKFSGNGGDDFFAEERAPPTLNQSQLRIEFVGAIDINVDVIHLIKGSQGDTARLRESLGIDRGGYAADFQASPDTLPEELNEVGGGGAAAQANDVSFLNKFQTGARGGLFFLIA